MRNQQQMSQAYGRAARTEMIKKRLHKASMLRADGIATRGLGIRGTEMLRCQEPPSKQQPPHGLVPAGLVWFGGPL